MLALDIKKLTDVFIQEYTHSSGKNDSLKAERLDPQVDFGDKDNELLMHVANAIFSMIPSEAVYCRPFHLSPD